MGDERWLSVSVSSPLSVCSKIPPQKQLKSNRVILAQVQGKSGHQKPEASWGGKGLFGLHFYSTAHHPRKLEQELKQGWNLEAENDEYFCPAYISLFVQ